MSFEIQDGIHARLACSITCRRLENIATNFLQFHFMNPDDFNFFLLELSLFCPSFNTSTDEAYMVQKIQCGCVCWGQVLKGGPHVLVLITLKIK